MIDDSRGVTSLLGIAIDATETASSNAVVCRLLVHALQYCLPYVEQLCGEYFEERNVSLPPHK